MSRLLPLPLLRVLALGIVAAGVVAVGVAWAGGALPDGREGAKGAARALPVATAAPEPATRFARWRTFTGEVRARRTSPLGFERAGRVVRLDVEEGSVVASGATLARLDDRKLAVERLRVDAHRAEAQAVLDEMRAGPRKEVLAAAEEGVADLKAQAEFVERMTKRRKQLLEERWISDEAFDEIANRHDSIRARLRAAEDRVEELREGTRHERVAAQEARLAQLDASVQRLDLDVEDCTLEAPFAGRILHRHVDEGTVVAPGQPVLTLVEDGVLEAWVGVPPPAAASLPVGSTETVRVGEASFSATVRARLPGTDAVTRTQTLLLTLPLEAAERVVPGQIVRLEVEEVVEETGFWVPASALARGTRGLWALYAVEEDAEDGRTRALRHHVEVLHTAEDRAFVRGTLDATSVVIVGNAERIAPGQVVQVVGHGPGAPSPAAGSQRPAPGTLPPAPGTPSPAPDSPQPAPRSAPPVPGSPPPDPGAEAPVR